MTPAEQILRVANASSDENARRLTVETPQSRCRAGVARIDITPPVGIYHRMWGAAMHDRAEGVHKPLLATALWLEPESDRGNRRQIIITLDHCLMDRDECLRLRSAVACATGVSVDE